MASTKVLLVTNYFGIMHEVPLSNLDFYKSHNLKNPDKQYKWKEMDRDKALKFIEDNGGKDPEFITPTKAAQLTVAKDAEINELKEKNEAKEAELVKLREQLAKLTTPAKPTDPKAATTKSTENKTGSSNPPQE